MNNKKLLLIVLTCVVTVIMIDVKVFAQASVNQTILTREEQWLLPDQVDAALEKVGKSPNTLNGMLSRGLLLFRQARYQNEEKMAQEAYDYLDEIYQNNEKLKTPGLLVYVGASYAFIGGAIKKVQPLKKIRLLNEGIEMINTAIKGLEQENNPLSLGVAYLIRGSIRAGAPSFLKASKGVVKDLKTATYYFKKAKLDDAGKSELVVNIYSTYADYYFKIGEVARAKKYVTEGSNKTNSPQLKQYLAYQLQKMN